MNKTVIIDEFIKRIPDRWILVLHTDRSPGIVDHILEMLYKIERIVLHNESAGDFCTAIAEQNYSLAVLRADDANFRHMGLYILFRDFLKNVGEKKV